MKIIHILAPRQVDLDAFDAAVAFHERLFGEPARLRLNLSEGRLRIAQVASMLFTAAEPALRAEQPAIDAVYIVRGLEAFAAHLDSVGVECVQPIVEIATGRNMIVRHPDGSMIEYVEHTMPHPLDDLLALAPASRSGGLR